MDFDAAIKAHSDWKLKLASYLRKRDGSLKAAEVCLDNQCALGKWIYGEGARYAKLPPFATLRSTHTRFHKEAAEVIRRADAGKDVSEEVMLGSSSGYTTASKAVVSAIFEMKTSLRQPA